MMLLWLVVIGILAYYLWRGGELDWARTKPRESAQDILKKRLAQGDISISEYRTLRQLLEEEQ
jgi:uncharacterized membrane protein